MKDQLPTPTLAEFAEQVDEFLSKHATRHANSNDTFRWGEGDEPRFSMSGSDLEDMNAVASSDWRRTRFDAGFGWITGPVAYGGRGLGLEYADVYWELERQFDVPYAAGPSFLLLAIALNGPPGLCDRYLRGLCRGDIRLCQLFSEPGAGSDLAGLETRAERDGDDWLLNGQKVWSSAAHLADVGFILCRTDPTRPKHGGITAFLLDMNVPGVDVRPLREMTGHAFFNEVFLTDARVADSNRIGAVNDGWNVAISTLMHERSALGRSWESIADVVAPARLVAMLKHFHLQDDVTFRQELADLYIRFRTADWTHQRMVAGVKTGATPGAQLSVTKLLASDNIARAANFAARVLGPRVTADSGEWGTFAWSEFVLGAPLARLGGGTDEIQKNIIAERVLKLPKDPYNDNAIAFNQRRRAAAPATAKPS